MIYSNQVRDAVIKEHRGATFGEIGKIIGAKWRNLTVEERQPYEQLSAADKARHAKEVEKYNQRLAVVSSASDEDGGDDGAALEFETGDMEEDDEDED